MQGGSPDRIVASFTETQMNLKFATRIEGNEIIFPGVKDSPATVPMRESEARKLRQTIVALKASNPDLKYPHLVSGADLPMRKITVTEPPELALEVEGSPYNPNTPPQLAEIRRIIYDARARLPNS